MRRRETRKAAVDVPRGQPTIFQAFKRPATGMSSSVRQSDEGDPTNDLAACSGGTNTASTKSADLGPGTSSSHHDDDNVACQESGTKSSSEAFTESTTLKQDRIMRKFSSSLLPRDKATELDTVRITPG